MSGLMQGTLGPKWAELFFPHLPEEGIGAEHIGLWWHFRCAGGPLGSRRRTRTITVLLVPKTVAWRPARPVVLPEPWPNGGTTPGWLPGACLQRSSSHPGPNAQLGLDGHAVVHDHMPMGGDIIMPVLSYRA